MNKITKETKLLIGLAVLIVTGLVLGCVDIKSLLLNIPGMHTFVMNLNFIAGVLKKYATLIVGGLILWGIIFWRKYADIKIPSISIAGIEFNLKNIDKVVKTNLTNYFITKRSLFKIEAEHDNFDDVFESYYNIYEFIRMQMSYSIYKAMQIKHLEKREHMPKQLFKFFPFNQNSIKCIETNTVFMNNPKNFNDPFDCLLCVDKKEFIKKCLIEKLIETRAVERGILSEEELMKLETSEFEENQSYFSNRNTFERILFELKYDVNNQKERVGADEIYRIIRQINEEYSKGLGKLRENTAKITSFADLNEFQLTTFMELWAHYSQNHEGFCVEYDLTKPIVNNNETEMILGGLLPCIYSAKQLVLSKRKFYKYVKRIPFTKHEKIEFEKNILLSFITKSSSWSYENEWRLILSNNICEIYENKIPFFPIKAIYNGCRMAKDNKEFIYQMAQRKGIEVYDMTMHDYQFRLEEICKSTDIKGYFEHKKLMQELNMKNLRIN